LNLLLPSLAKEEMARRSNAESLKFFYMAAAMPKEAEPGLIYGQIKLILGKLLQLN